MRNCILIFSSCVTVHISNGSEQKGAKQIEIKNGDKKGTLREKVY